MSGYTNDRDVEAKLSFQSESDLLLEASELDARVSRSPIRLLRPRLASRLWRWLPWSLVAVLLVFSTRPHEYIRRYKASSAKPPPVLIPVSNKTVDKALIIASYAEQDVSWIDSIPSDWTINRYLLDDSNPLHNLTVPRNQGREAAAYLSYVVDNYDVLPDYMVFLQGHARAWHQPEHVVQLVRSLNLSAVEEHKYVNLKCEERPACDGLTWKETANTEEEWVPMLKAFWESQMGPAPRHLFPNLTAPREMKDEDWSAEQAADIVSSQIRPSPRSPLSVFNTGDWIALPPVLQYRCCGQFAVSKASIRQHPKSFWKRMQAPLIRDLWDHEGWGSVDTYGVGLFYEVTWHLLFGDKRTQATGTACPSKSYCRRVMFSGLMDCQNEDGNTGMAEQVDHWEVVNCKTPFDTEIQGLEHGHGTAWDDGREMYLLDILAEEEREREREEEEERQRQIEEEENERQRLEEERQREEDERERQRLEDEYAKQEWRKHDEAVKDLIPSEDGQEPEDDDAESHRSSDGVEALETSDSGPEISPPERLMDDII